MNKFKGKPDDFIFGKNSVAEAIKSENEINYIITCGKIPERLFAMIKERNIPIKRISQQNLDVLCKSSGHQGIVARISAKKYSNIDEMTTLAKNKKQMPFLVILDKIQDPYNVGAIIRTAECMGIHGIITCKRCAAGLTAAVEKVSSGALEHILVSRETNLSSTIGTLKKQGFWIFGADVSGKNISKTKPAIFSSPVVLVIGSEGKGISRLIKKKCDFILSIPMNGKINSLNASVAAGIFMHKINEYRKLPGN